MNRLKIQLTSMNNGVTLFPLYNGYRVLSWLKFEAPCRSRIRDACTEPDVTVMHHELFARKGELIGLGFYSPLASILRKVALAKTYLLIRDMRADMPLGTWFEVPAYRHL